jgi:hypothetical protein
MIEVEFYKITYIQKGSVAKFTMDLAHQLYQYWKGG